MHVIGVGTTRHTIGAGRRSSTCSMGSGTHTGPPGAERQEACQGYCLGCTAPMAQSCFGTSASTSASAAQ
eukprot:1941616-Prymnesium_polylepis.3